MKDSGIIVNRAGTLKQQSHYYPYGGNRGSAFSPWTTKRFTGQYHESGLPSGEGLSYYNARWYDAQLGRFVSADTLVPNPGNPQDLNRMAYVKGNPLNLIDPDGHDPWWLQDGPWNTSPQQLLLPEYAGQAQDALTARQQQRVSNYYRPPAPTLSHLATTTGGRIAVEMVNYTPVFNASGQIDWERTVGSTFGKALKVCAIAADGVCGISLGGHGDFAGAGIRGSLDVFVDQNGNIEILGTFGGGGYVPGMALASGGLIAVQGETSRLTVLAIRNANAKDMRGFAGQFGGGIAINQGVTSEWVFGQNSSGEYWHGAAVGASTGTFAEIHLTATYSVAGSDIRTRISTIWDYIK